MRTFGKNLSTLHRELGMQLTIKAGEFDRIVQPYACDSAALPRILQTDLQRETPHPDYRNMFLDEVDVIRDVAGITRMRATYFGIAGAGDNKPPEISLKTGDVTRITFSGVILAILYVTKKFVTARQPDDTIFFKPQSSQDLGILPSQQTGIACMSVDGATYCWFGNQDTSFWCTAQDWNKIGGFYEVTQQFRGPRMSAPNT
jgi:hypothetical protein